MQTQHKRISLFLIVLLSTFGVLAQHHVKGSLVDDKNGSPLMYVNCVLLNADDSTFVYGTTSDAKGTFHFQQVAAGNYLLRVSFVGYQTYWHTLSVNADVALGRVEMSQSATTLSAVKVTAQKPLYAVDGEKQLYNVTEDPSVQTGTMSDVLQNAPGVEVDAEGNITLRGTQSVEIWINDRPSHMNEEAMKQYIKQLPANAIDRVEVITNPSARYSSKGAVVNIITNQKVKRNELLCVGAKVNTTPSYSPWLSYVWANDKVDLNIYLNGYYRRQERASDGTSTLFDANGDTSRFQQYDNKNIMPYWGGYLGLNANWQIDSTRTLSAWAGAYPYWDQNSFFNDYRYYEYFPARVDRGYIDTTLNHGFTHGGNIGAWYERQFDTTGRKLSVTLMGNTWNNSGYSDDSRYYRSASLADFKRHMEGLTIFTTGGMEVEYTHPLKNDFELESGAELGLGRYYENETLDSLLPSGGWDPMIYRTTLVDVLEINAAVYTTLQKRWGGFTAKLGLRFTDDFGIGMLVHPLVGDTCNIDKSFPGIVPSIHLSYQTKNFESYSLSYTRRFSYSGDWSDYALFRRYDDYSFSTGNPNLLLNYSHNLEAAFNKYVKNFGNIGISAYFHANTDEISTMTGAATDSILGPYLVDYSYPVNIGSSHTEGISANITYRPTGFLNVRFSASLFNYGYDYNDFSDSKLSYSFRLNVWAKLWKRLEVFANGSYTSPRLGLYTLTNANKRFDFGCSSDFFKRKMSVYLNVSDIFGWSEWGSNTTAPQYQTTGSSRYNSTFVSLGLTFRFGKMELESKARQGESQSSMTSPK